MKTFSRKIYESRLYLPGLWFLYLLLAGAFVYVIDYYPKGDIENALKTWVPWNLRINFLLLLIGVVICRRDIVGAVRDIQETGEREERQSRRRYLRGWLLAGLVLAAFVMTAFVAPRVHRIYYDEDIYASMGQVIALIGQTGMCQFGTFDYGQFNATWLSYYKEPSGWPFLMSLVFQLFGTDELYAFVLNNAIFAGGVLVVFFIVWNLSGRFFPAFSAALVFALIPHNLIWSNTVAAEPSAAFFAGLAVLCLVIYLKTNKARHVYMPAVVLPLACQMRPESGLILLWVVIALIVCFRDENKVIEGEGQREGEGGGEQKAGMVKERGRIRGVLFRKEIWTAGIITLIFLMPHLFHLYVTGGESWGAQGVKFSMEFFWNNLSFNGPYYLNNATFPALFTFLALVGLVFARIDLRWRLIILLWFVLFWGIFLFFYAGSYNYGADVRFALVTYMPVAVLAGMGAERIRSWMEGLTEKGSGLGAPARVNGKTVGILIILVLIFVCLPFLPLVRTVGQEAWGARHDHQYAREFIKKIPARSIVLTHNPTMFFVWGQSAIQAYAGIENPDIIQNLMDKYQGHVYFHYNFWCNVRSDANRGICEGIRAKYNLEEIDRATEQTYEYALYKMSNK